MLLKNISGQGVYLFEYNTTTGAGNAGDSANITGTVSKDGGSAAAFTTTHPTNVGGGLYFQPLAQSETNCDAFGMVWATTTSGMQIDPVFGFTGSITSNVKKNQPLAAFPFVMTDSTNHAPTPGLTVTATRSLDGAAFAACANSPTSLASGSYKIDLAATDTNANTVQLRLTATGADDLLVTLVTQP